MRVLVIFAIMAGAASVTKGQGQGQGQGQDDCNPFCPLFYQPICGINSDGYLKTFGNPCFLKVENDCNGGDYEYLYCGVCDTKSFTLRR